MNDIVYDPYLIPGSDTLRNLLHVTEQHELRMMESELSNTRMIEFFDGIPQVEPTIQGVRAIHRGPGAAPVASLLAGDLFDLDFLPGALPPVGQHAHVLETGRTGKDRGRIGGGEDGFCFIAHTTSMNRLHSFFHSHPATMRRAHKIPMFPRVLR